MGSKIFEGIRFSAFSSDHLPPHVHGIYAETRVIVELVDGTTRLASRQDAIAPLNCKRSDVKRILNAATEHADELLQLWTVSRG